MTVIHKLRPSSAKYQEIWDENQQSYGKKKGIKHNFNVGNHKVVQTNSNKLDKYKPKYLSLKSEEVTKTDHKLKQLPRFSHENPYPDNDDKINVEHDDNSEEYEQSQNLNEDLHSLTLFNNDEDSNIHANSILNDHYKQFWIPIQTSYIN
ncbi:hypothetical protein ACTFIW_003898 [Dictyostelium discoideum]